VTAEHLTAIYITSSCSSLLSKHLQKISKRQLDIVQYISTLQEHSYLPALWEVCHINHRQFISHLLELEYLFSCTRDRVQDVEKTGRPIRYPEGLKSSIEGMRLPFDQRRVTNALANLQRIEELRTNSLSRRQLQIYESVKPSIYMPCSSLEGPEGRQSCKRI
jgi:hypothetical protein